MAPHCQELWQSGQGTYAGQAARKLEGHIKEQWRAYGTQKSFPKGKPGRRQDSDVDAGRRKGTGLADGNRQNR